MTRQPRHVDRNQTASFEETTARATVSSEAERRAHVGKWIARMQRTGAAMLGTAVLVLPVVAGAQTAGDGLVNAAGIDGVQKVQVLEDGSVRLTLDNGRIMNVAADDVVIGAAGEVQLSAQVAEIVGDAAASGGGGGGAGGVIAAGAAAGVAGLVGAGAGGGGDGGGTSEPAPIVLNASDVAGFNTFSDVFGRTPEGDPDRVTITVGDGEGIELTPGEGGDWDLPDGFADNFAGRDGEEVTISFTAEREVPSEEEEGADEDPVVDDGEVILAASTAEEDPEIEEVDSGSVTRLVDTVAPTITIDEDITGDGVLNIAEQQAGFDITGTSNAEDGQEVIVTLSGAAGTPVTAAGTVQGGAWTVSFTLAQAEDLENWSIVDVSATVADATGNPADTPATASFDIDFTAPTIAIDPVSGDDQIGLADLEGDLEITGTTDAEAGQAVTLTFDGQEFSGVVTSDGHGGQVWSVTVPQSAVAAVQTGAGADGLSNVDVSATVADAAGNPAEQPATRSLAADFNGPSISIAPITGDNVINADESGTDVTISGTTSNVGAGQTVTVTVDGHPLTADTDASGGWSVTLLQADVVGLGDAASVAVTADVLDSDGVAAPQAGATLATDFTAPMIHIDTPIAEDDTLNIEERDTGFDITGTTDAEDGQTVTVTVAGETYSASATGGKWSVTVPSGDLAGLTDDDTVTVAATVEDAAGNPAEPATTTFDTDFTAPTISVSDLAGLTAGDELTAGDLVDAAGDPLTEPLRVNGTSDAIGQEVTVTIGTIEATSTVLDDGFGHGIWSVDVDAGLLGNELSGQTTTTISATVEDAAGNPGTGTFDLDVDLTLPEITIDAPADAAVLGLDAFEDGLDVSGTTTGVPDGQQVTIEIRNSTDSVVGTTTTTVASDAWSGSFDATVIAGLDDEAGFTLNARVNDGDFPVDATADIALSTDFAPELTIGEIGEDGVLILEEIDPSNVSINGTTRGIEAGQAVSVNILDDTGATIFFDTTNVLADGTWTLDLSEGEVNGLDAGQTYDVQADVSNAAGRDAPQAQSQVVPYEAAQTYLVEDSANGSQVTMQILLDPRTELPDDGGFALGETLTFDPSEIAFLDTPAPAAPAGSFVITNDQQAANGEVGFVVSGFIPGSFDTSEDAVLQFAMGQQTTDAVIQLDVASTEGGAYSSLFGTSAADTIAANNVDTLIRGRGGDDAIDLSGAGVNTVQFEADPAANGFDTVTGFSIGGPLPDRLGFAGLNHEDLRGNGSEFHLLAGGDAVGADTGLIVFTTAMNDLSEGSVQAAIQGLSGPAEGDVLYFLATDGSDAQLYEVQVQDGADTVANLARFGGLGDLTSMTDANILGFDTSSMIT